MRPRWLATLILCTVFLPFAAHAGETQLDAKRAERLIWDGHFQEAVEYLEPRLTVNRTTVARFLCLAYALWGDDEHTLYHCNAALQNSPYPNLADCVWRQMQRKGAINNDPTDLLCQFFTEYPYLAEIKALQALAYWRSGDAKEAANPLYMALAAHKPPPWLVRMIDVVIRTPTDQEPQELARIRQGLEFWEKPRFDLARARFFPEAEEPPHTSQTPQTAAPPASEPTSYIAVAGLALLGLLALTAIYTQRARVTAFLSAPTSQATPVPQDVEAPRPPMPSPAPQPPAFMRYPSYVEAGYPNRAYQIAAWAWAGFWILLCLPLVLLAAIPAVTILLDFSARGLQSAAANAQHFAAQFALWGRLWFGLLLLSLSTFAITKIYGRYSLPKPLRPRIHVIRTTIRFVFLTVSLLSVGTFLAYFSGAIANLYANPLVRFLVDRLRSMLGF